MMHGLRQGLVAVLAIACCAAAITFGVEAMVSAAGGMNCGVAILTILAMVVGWLGTSLAHYGAHEEEDRCDGFKE